MRTASHLSATVKRLWQKCSDLRMSTWQLSCGDVKSLGDWLIDWLKRLLKYTGWGRREKREWAVGGHPSPVGRVPSQPSWPERGDLFFSISAFHLRREAYNPPCPGKKKYTRCCSFKLARALFKSWRDGMVWLRHGRHRSHMLRSRCIRIRSKGERNKVTSERSLKSGRCNWREWAEEPPCLCRK